MGGRAAEGRTTAALLLLRKCYSVERYNSEFLNLIMHIIYIIYLFCRDAATRVFRFLLILSISLNYEVSESLLSNTTA